LIKSTFKDDNNAEKVLGEFIEKYLYKPLEKDSKIAQYIRMSDKENQKKGIDVEIYENNIRHIVDEKSALHYMNDGIPTFALELSYYDKVGWFIRDDLSTDYYMLIWPYVEKELYDKYVTDKKNLKKKQVRELLKNITVDSFTTIECILISKKAIYEWLNEINIDKKYLENKVKEINASKQSGKFDGLNDNHYYIRSKSEEYNETPINLIIRKPILEELCKHHYKFSKTGYEIIK
jgi:hypothetical protein